MAQLFSKIVPWLPIIQMTLSVVMIASILLQARGTGVGGSFGGSSSVYRTRRGIEKSLFRATIILGVLFAVVSLARVLLG